MTAIEIIRLIGTEYISVADETLAQWVELVSPLVSKKRFGKLYEQAIALLVCHKLKMAGVTGNSSGSSGTVSIPPITQTAGISSLSEGETSVSFGSSSSSNTASDAEYGLTSYGMQYLTLRRGVIVPITCSGERSE